MSDKKKYGYCPKHCKHEVYGVTDIDKMLQELEAGTLSTLAWYKGGNEKYHYEFSGVDPNTITLTTYTNLLIAMLSDCANLTAEDMAKILKVENMAVKLWYNGNEYYAVKLTDKLVLTKTNVYIREFDAGAVETSFTFSSKEECETKLSNAVAEIKNNVLSATFANSPIYNEDETAFTSLKTLLKDYNHSDVKALSGTISITIGIGGNYEGSLETLENIKFQCLFDTFHKNYNSAYCCLFTFDSNYIENVRFTMILDNTEALQIQTLTFSTKDQNYVPKSIELQELNVFLK